MNLYVHVFEEGLELGIELTMRCVKSQKYHLENPYWKTFDPYVVPLLDKAMDLRRHEELDTSQDVEVPL